MAFWRGELLKLLARINALEAAVREKLTADRTYYVRSDGNNGNTGLADTAGGAFLTWQYAYDFVCANIDLGGKTVTIKHGEETGAKTFAPASGVPVLAIDKTWTGGGTIAFEGSAGDIITPSDLVWSTSGGISNVVITVLLPGSLTFYGLQSKATSGGWGGFLEHSGVGPVKFRGIDFNDTEYNFITLGAAAIVEVLGNYTISGSAQAFIEVDGPGRFFQSGQTVTISGTPAWATAFVNARDNGFIGFLGVTFSGSATGPRYLATLGGVINTYGSGATFLPGNAAGTATAPGAYA